MRTGKICKHEGIYSCAVHPLFTTTILKNEVYPQCPVFGQLHDTRWVLVESKQAPEDRTEDEFD